MFAMKIVHGEIAVHATATTEMFLTTQRNQRFTLLKLIFASPRDLHQHLTSRDMSKANTEEVLQSNRKFPSLLANIASGLGGLGRKELT